MIQTTDNEIIKSLECCSTGETYDDCEKNGCPPKIPEENRCRYCTEFEDLPEHIINGKPVGKVFDTSIDKDENGWHICLPSDSDIGIKFCPYCGRELKDNNTIPSTHDVNQWLISDLDDIIDCF